MFYKILIILQFFIGCEVDLYHKLEQKTFQSGRNRRCFTVIEIIDNKKINFSVELRLHSIQLLLQLPVFYLRICFEKTHTKAKQTCFKSLIFK